jgi:hypothetical protein
MARRLKLQYDESIANVAFNIQLAPLHHGYPYLNVTCKMLIPKDADYLNMGAGVKMGARVSFVEHGVSKYSSDGGYSSDDSGYSSASSGRGGGGGEGGGEGGGGGGGGEGGGGEGSGGCGGGEGSKEYTRVADYFSSFEKKRTVSISCVLNSARLVM